MRIKRTGTRLVIKGKRYFKLISHPWNPGYITSGEQVGHEAVECLAITCR